MAAQSDVASANPKIVILGGSAVAQNLVRLAKAIGYEVAVTAPGLAREKFSGADATGESFDLSAFGVTPQTFVVVSTQGESDEAGLEAAVRSEAGYVAFIASKTKAQKISDDLLDKGISAGRIAALKAPAGLAIGAVSPEEIAVSVLAEIVQVLRSRAGAPEKPGRKGVPVPAPVEGATAKDPVCGMGLDAANVKFKSDYEGRPYYFCSKICKQKFDRAPAHYSALARG